MQKVDTAELRRLHEATTKGKWRHFRDEFVRGRIDRVIAAPGQVVLRDEDIHRHAWKDDPRVDADWDFIAAAHNALPALLDELEAARVELEALKVPLAVYERHAKLIGAAEELERSAKTLREDLADMNPPEFASRGKVAPGYCECLQDVADGMEERAAQLRREAEEK